MKYFKKHPIFSVIFFALLLAFVAGLSLDAYLYFFVAPEANKKLNRAVSKYNSALTQDPSQVAIDASKANLDKLLTRLDFLEKDLTRARSDIFQEASPKEGFEFVERLRGYVNKWRKEATSHDIKVMSDMDFGFKKYVAPMPDSPEPKAIPSLWRQACVLDYINAKLFKCKSEKSPMMIKVIQRELLPEEIVKVDPREAKMAARSRRPVMESPTGDTFKIDNAITCRKEGSLDTLAYKFVFLGHTDVLRRFLNQLKDFDAMLVVRSIGVVPANISDIDKFDRDAGVTAGEEIAGGTSMDAFPAAPPANGGAEGAPAVGNEENRKPVVVDNISEFTVIIEYVEVVKEAPKKESADKDDEDSGDNNKKKSA